MAGTKNNLIWFTEPAGRDFNKALPIGNGRLGGMFYGNVGRNHAYTEKFLINEESVWCRNGTEDRHNPDAVANIPRIRELLLAGRIAEAEDLAQISLASIPRDQAPFQLLAELHFNWSAGCLPHEVSGYRRWLDLETGIAGSQWTVDGEPYAVEVFSSASLAQRRYFLLSACSSACFPKVLRRGRLSQAATQEFSVGNDSLHCKNYVE